MGILTTVSNDIVLRDEILRWLRSEGYAAWACYAGPALFVGTTKADGKLCLIEVAGREPDEAQRIWISRMKMMGVDHVAVSSLDAARPLFPRAPWVLTDDEIEDAITSAPDIYHQTHNDNA